MGFSKFRSRTDHFAESAVGLTVRTSLQQIRTLTKKLLNDDSGQSTVEYILILSACVVGATQMARQLLNILDKGILRVGGQLEKDLKTGRAPLHVWSN